MSAGYLVTDDEGGTFSDSRKNHQLRRVGVFGTGFPLAACFGGDLDAPEWILGGSVIESFGVPFPSGVGRGADGATGPVQVWVRRGGM